MLANHPRKRQRTELNTAQRAVEIAVGFLADEFEKREAASKAFLPEITSSNIQTSVSKYESEMLEATKKSVCCSCGILVATADVCQINENDDLIQPLQGLLDHCGHRGNSWDFCTLCHTALSCSTTPKFSAKNLVNVTMCHEYPNALEDLTPVEECLIAKSHPIGTILKLRPGNHPSSAGYNALRGHMILIPQDPGPLLRILPCPELKLNNLIKVFWLGKQAPMDFDLRPFLRVRKDKVLAALRYLVQHNHLYYNLGINHDMINNWPDDFIPPEIWNNIICLEKSDHHEREGYTINLENGNHENDFHASHNESVHADDEEAFITGSVYTDINGERQDPNVRMINALLGLVANNPRRPNETVLPQEDISDNHSQDQQKLPMLSYAIRGRATLMSNWENPQYFTTAFPTLFPNGIGGHQD